MQTHNIAINHVNVMETSLQSIGRLTQSLLPDEAGNLFIAGEEECYSLKIARHNMSFFDNTNCGAVNE